MTCAYALRDAIQGRRRPLYVRALRVSGAARRTDGGGGSGYADRPPGFMAADLAFHDACSMSPSPSSPGSGSVPWAPRASVPLVGGISLPIDAVRVDLEQDRDAVRATSVAGTPEFSQGHGSVPQVVAAACYASHAMSISRRLSLAWPWQSVSARGNRLHRERRAWREPPS
jgi:hypothetical protein